MWSAAGECDKNPVYMLRECMVSCNQCPSWQLPDANSTELKQRHNMTLSHKCSDNEERCGMWASAGECEKNPIYMLRECMVSCNQCTPSSSDSSGGSGDADAGGSSSGSASTSGGSGSSGSSGAANSTLPNPNSNGNMTVLPDGMVVKKADAMTVKKPKHVAAAPSSPVWGHGVGSAVRHRAPSAPSWSSLNETIQRDLARDLMSAPVIGPRANIPTAATATGSTLMGSGSAAVSVASVTATEAAVLHEGAKQDAESRIGANLAKVQPSPVASIIKP